MASKVDSLIEKVKDAAREIYSKFGREYLENVYEESMAIGLREREMTYEVERNREIFYKGTKVGTHRLDFIIENTLVVELKAGTSTTNSHKGQTCAYLKATGLKNGIIINFPFPEASEPNFQLIPEEGK